MSHSTPRAGVGHRQPRPVEGHLRRSVEAADVISLTGGVPADELFPAAEMDEAMRRLMRDHGASALQYGWPLGDAALRAQIAARMASRGVPASVEQVLITSGAQQALQLIARLLLVQGAPIAVELPTYMSALQAFDLQKPIYRAVPRSAQGLDLDQLEAALGAGGARLVYLVATGHNPTGGVLRPGTREAVLDLVERHDAWLIDDDAYGELGYDAPHVPLQALDRASGRVLHVGSFSKVLAPGLRVGWICAPATLIAQLSVIKQAQDLETATLSQQVLSTWLDQHSLDAHIRKALTCYRARRDALHAALARDMVGLARWERSEAGFSALLHVEGVDAAELLPRAIEAGVAFEPAAPYFATGAAPHAIRLCFSNVAETQLRQGVNRLARVLAAHQTRAAT